jgi:5-methylcytosine-specific restriction endonuclease McrBC regulatory subunit McrC
MNGQSMHVRDIVVDEAGSANPKVWTGKGSSLGNDLDTIRFHADRNIIDLEERSGELLIKGKYRTGIILLPSGRRIILRTKLPGIVLLDWLVYLGEFPEFQHWSPAGNVTVDDDWQKVLIKLFLMELDIVTRWHLRKDFVKLQIESSQVRGRVLAGALAQKIWRLPKIPQIIRGRSFETPPNRMLALALKVVAMKQDLLLEKQLDDSSRNLLFRLRSEWSEITVDDVDRNQIVADGLTVAPSGYRNALQLARLILFGASIDSKSGWGGQSFTLSLAGVWERGLRKMCRELTSITGWRSLSSHNRTRPWDDAKSHDDPNRMMISDILLQRESERWVLDAKYKCDFGRESRNDRFQICTYALGFRANRSTLVYPSQESSILDQRDLLVVDIGGVQIRVDSLALPMASGPQRCTEALRAKLQSVP